MLNSPLIQVIISLVLLIFLGYFAYYIYLIELENMLKTSKDIKKQVTIFKGIYDLKKGESVYETTDMTKENYVDINPSINQSGGAEYSYNFWLYIDKDKLNSAYANVTAERKNDIVLFLKGEKKFYHSMLNKNCSNKIYGSTDQYFNIMIKNPLVRLKHDGSSIVVEYNNIYNPESYQSRTTTESKTCDNTQDWMKKNGNLIGIYDLEFNTKWFMVTIIMKEVSDSHNILSKNKASCKMFINGLNVLDKKVDTIYNNKTSSATFRTNKSPLYFNPSFNAFKDYFRTMYGNHLLSDSPDTIKISDLTYFNYSLTDVEVAKLYANGFNKTIVEEEKKKGVVYDLVSSSEMEKSSIKEI
jgi:hypothetical protein